MKRIVILGSTGSIGRSALDIVSYHPGKFEVIALSTRTQVGLLEKQIKKFRPKYAVIADTEKGRVFAENYRGDTQILLGKENLNTISSLPEADIVLTAVMGAVGIAPTLSAIEAGKTIALANKETLVAAGDLVMKRAVQKKIKILPVDSEHSAIFQCMEGKLNSFPKRLLLTASGGPFYGFSHEQLARVTLMECLAHPTWKMGPKITIDSASMFNKGLEVIEAHHLFGVGYDNIEITVHRQSIVHSMIEFEDGAILAQMGVPDMKLPIQLAFSYPERLEIPQNYINWEQPLTLTFEKPNCQLFRSIPLAYEAGKKGRSAPLALNAANEVAVSTFLEGRIQFVQLFDIVEHILTHHLVTNIRDFEDIQRLDQEVREQTKDYIKQLK